MSTVVTPVFVGSYPNLFVPRPCSYQGAPQLDKNGVQKKEYSVTALFPPGTDLTKVNAAIKEALVERLGADTKKWPKDLVSPLKNQADAAKENDKGEMVLPPGHFEGGKKLTMKSQKPITVVASDAVTILTEANSDMFYGGVYLIAKVNFVAYPAKPAKPKGVSCYLQAIQRVKDGPRLSGGDSGDATAGFVPVEVSPAFQDEASSDADPIFG